MATPPTSDGKAHSHRRLKGYEVCIHTCNGPACRRKGMASGILWAKEGGAASRHATKASMHRRCDCSCPGWKALQRGGGERIGRSAKTRAPTQDELVQHLPPDEAQEELERMQGGACMPSLVAFNDPSECSTTTSSNSSVAQPCLPLPTRQGEDHKFSVLFIPDPTCRASRAEAEGNLSWAERIITNEQFARIKGMTNSVHRLRTLGCGLSTKVRVAEWVSPASQSRSLWR